MTEHERIERALHDAAGDIRVGTGVSSNVRRRIRVRRIGTAATGLVVAASLVFGASFAAGAFTPERVKMGPAQENSDRLIEYRRTGGFEGSDSRLTIDNQGNTVLHYTVRTDGLVLEGTLTRVELMDVEDAIAVIDWPALDGSHDLAAGVGAMDGYEYEIRHDDYVVTAVSSAEPRELKPLMELLDAVIENELARQQASELSRCGPPVDFLPTDLPGGWVAELQEGSAVGPDARHDVIGHYGNGEQPGTEQKMVDGFLDLSVKDISMEIFGEPNMTVLGEPAVLHDSESGSWVTFQQYDCVYRLLGFGIETEELKRFAQGLRLPGTYVPAEPSDEENFVAIWPEDTLAHAEEACTSEAHKPDSWRADPESTALEFGALVLGWEEPALIDPYEQGENVLVYELRRDDRSGPGVLVYPTEVMTTCWSVGHVSRLLEDQPKHDGSMTVRGRDVQMGFDLGEAASAVFEVGYGGETTRYIWEGGPTGVEFRLDFEPRGTGHFLVLLRDANGNVFSAFGSPLPEGDFAAG